MTPHGVHFIPLGLLVVSTWLAWRHLSVPDPYQPLTSSQDGVTLAGLGRKAQRLLRRKPPIDITTSGPTPPATGGLVITCSGGGIRAAAFTLGGLQRLRDESAETETPAPSLYDRSTRVYGVSGGSYMATSLHLAERHSDSSTDPPLFGPDSPEADWLRRKSSYLLPSRKAWFRGLYSITFGLAVNLAMVGAAIWLAAAYVAWALTQVSQAPSGLDVLPRQVGDFRRGP